MTEIGRVQTKTFLSWGCGVQSTTLGEMSARGDLPPLDGIISSDTGWEREATCEIRDWYAARWRRMGLHVKVVAGGNIRLEGAEEHIHIPFWTSNGGPLRRQCTYQFKVRPVRRCLRTMMGHHATRPPHPRPGSAEQLLGISLDEWARMKDSRVKFIDHRYPLIELRMTRQDCIGYLSDRNLPIPPKSACVCCPYRTAAEWLEMKRDAPAEWAAAVAFDEANRHNPLGGNKGSTASELYIWKDTRSGPGPLRDADLEGSVRRTRRPRQGFQLPLLCESGYRWA